MAWAARSPAGPSPGTGSLDPWGCVGGSRRLPSLPPPPSSWLQPTPPLSTTTIAREASTCVAGWHFRGVLWELGLSTNGKHMSGISSAHASRGLPTEKGLPRESRQHGGPGPSGSWVLARRGIEGPLLILLPCASPLGSRLPPTVPGLSCLRAFAQAVPPQRALSQPLFESFMSQRV